MGWATSAYNGVMDNLDPIDADENDVTDDIRDFIVENMTSNEIESMAFEIGIDTHDLAGQLPEEMASALILRMAQRDELQLLDRALRDLRPVEYGQRFRDEMD